MQTDELIQDFTETLIESGSRHGIMEGLPARPANGRWSGENFIDVMQIVGRALDDAHFGLGRTRCPLQAQQFGVEVMLLSSNLGDALDRYSRFFAIASRELSIDVERTSKQVNIHLRGPGPDFDPRQFLIEWNAVRILGISQWLVGASFAGAEVAFAHKRRLPAAVYASVLGESVAFEQSSNRISFPVHELSRRVIFDAQDLTRLWSKRFEENSNNYLNENWSALVKSSLRDSLLRMEPLPTMEDLARKFRVSSQTLRRGLKAEGGSYRAVKDSARRDVVLNNIGDTSLTLGQISVLAGFAETNGLERAMKNWTGLRPSDVRRNMLQGDMAAGNAREFLQAPRNDKR